MSSCQRTPRALRLPTFTSTWRTGSTSGQWASTRTPSATWLAGGDGPADLKPRWEHRLGLLGEDAYGDPHRPSPDRIELVTYPEAVTMTRLAFPASPRHTDILAETPRPEISAILSTRRPQTRPQT